MQQHLIRRRAAPPPEVDRESTGRPAVALASLSPGRGGNGMACRDGCCRSRCRGVACDICLTRRRAVALGARALTPNRRDPRPGPRLPRGAGRTSPSRGRLPGRAGSDSTGCDAPRPAVAPIRLWAAPQLLAARRSHGCRLPARCLETSELLLDARSSLGAGCSASPSGARPGSRCPSTPARLSPGCSMPPSRRSGVSTTESTSHGTRVRHPWTRSSG